MNLSGLKPPAGQTKGRKRIGRGMGSGHGKTATRGSKGQHAGTGFSQKRGFEGGQMPVHRRLPKRGFTNIFKTQYAIVNLGRLQVALDAGQLKPDATVNGEALIAAGVLRRVRDGVRLLAKGELKAPLTIEVVGASKAAIAAVEKLGGKVIVAAKPAAAAS